MLNTALAPDSMSVPEAWSAAPASSAAFMFPCVSPSLMSLLQRHADEFLLPDAWRPHTTGSPGNGPEAQGIDFHKNISASPSGY